MRISKLFETPIWSEEKPEFINSLNSASDKYIQVARERDAEIIKRNKDFGWSHHSSSLIKDNNFFDFKKYVSLKSHEFLDHHGYDLSLYTLMYTDLWVQEFSPKGGGYHSAHTHWNQHVSGFYFLKCSRYTSYPAFYDPRPAAVMSKLKLKDQKGIKLGTEKVSIYPKPGTLIIFPGYVQHEFMVDHGIEPFRFIHFNIQAVANEFLPNV